MLLFLDTETTGRSRLKDRLVQLAWILTNESGMVIKEHSSIIKPDGFSIPIEASKIHGVTTDIAKKQGVPLQKCLEQLGALRNQAKLIIAHNLEFDMGILQGEFKRIKLDYPFNGIPSFCTMVSSVEFCKLPKPFGKAGYKWPRLDELHHELFGFNFDNAHDARADVAACKNCFFKLRELNAIKLPELFYERTRIAESSKKQEIEKRVIKERTRIAEPSKEQEKGKKDEAEQYWYPLTGQNASLDEDQSGLRTELAEAYVNELRAFGYRVNSKQKPVKIICPSGGVISCNYLYQIEEILRIERSKRRQAGGGQKELRQKKVEGFHAVFRRNQEIQSNSTSPGQGNSIPRISTHGLIYRPHMATVCKKLQELGCKFNFSSKVKRKIENITTPDGKIRNVYSTFDLEDLLNDLSADQ